MASTADILARIRARREASKQTTVLSESDIDIPSAIQQSPISQAAQAIIDAHNSQHQKSKDGLFEILDKYGNPITLNEKQSEFVNLAASGKSCVLIGAAGTGKTTCTKAAVSALIAANLLGVIPEGDTKHKYLPANSPGIAICAYTRRATNNIRRNQIPEVQGNCITLHKLLRFEPYVEEIEDPDTLEVKKIRTFAPVYCAENPLPQSIKCIVIEEASMVGMDLWNMLMAAIQHPVMFIFLGDLNQLPPVFGPAILGFKLLELPVVELTEVYRQALDSPIISLAHRVLSGKGIKKDELEADWAKRAGLKIVPWKKKISPEAATEVLAKFFVSAYNSGDYDPEMHGILIPFNKSCGTDELNLHIANAIAQKEGKEVFEIRHKWLKSYYSIGDKCLYEREDAIILNIYPNPSYSGAAPQPSSPTLDYWGNEHDDKRRVFTDEVDDILNAVGTGSGEDDEGKLAASHCIELQLLDSDRVIKLESAGKINALILGYAITVHKSQGSEWEKVFLCFHHTHASMIQRELLYTAVTRAKSELIMVCEADTFLKGIERAKIKGTTLAEKAEHFKGKQDRSVNDARADNML